MPSETLPSFHHSDFLLFRRCEELAASLKVTIAIKDTCFDVFEGTECLITQLFYVTTLNGFLRGLEVGRRTKKVPVPITPEGHTQVAIHMTTVGKDGETKKYDTALNIPSTELKSWSKTEVQEKVRPDSSCDHEVPAKPRKKVVKKRKPKTKTKKKK